MSADALYVPGRSEHERARLEHQSDVFGPLTRRFLEDAGLQTGMRVLDVGCGVGDVSFLVGELVGATTPDGVGSVVGIDADPDAVVRARARAAEYPVARFEFVEGDLRTAAIDGPFNAVVGRMVLMYLSDPVAAVTSAVRRLHHEGIVAFQENDFDLWSRTWVPSAPLLEECCRQFVEVHRRGGVDTAMGRRLNDVFLRSGLTQPSMSLHSNVVTSKDTEAVDLLVETLRSFAPAAADLGIYEASDFGLGDLAARLMRELRKTGGAGTTPPLVGAAARVSDAALTTDQRASKTVAQGAPPSR